MDPGYQSGSSDKEELIEDAIPLKTFNSLKESGNQLFKKTFQDKTLSVTEYQQQMCNALRYYHMACQLAQSSIEQSSIRKNMAVSQFHIAKRIAQCNPQNSTLMTKEFKFFVKESLNNFDKAIGIGRQAQKPSWTLQMTQKQSKCSKLMWDFLITSYGKGSSCILLGHMHKFCSSANEPSLCANLFLKLLHGISKRSTYQEEEVQLELTRDAVDCYLQFIVLSRDKSLESQVIAHGQLGRLYELMTLNEKSREYYKFTIQLAMAIHPKMDKFQQKQKWIDERKEREAIRAHMRIELKKVLDELKKASQQSAQELLNFIYSKHPPKRGTKSIDSTIRAQYKMALLHYHPDKQDLEEHGLKWIILSEEITVLLTYHFERMKSNPEREYAFKQAYSWESDDSCQCETEDDDDWETNSWGSWDTINSWATDDSINYFDTNQSEYSSEDEVNEDGARDDEESQDGASDFNKVFNSCEPAEDDSTKCDCSTKCDSVKDSKDCLSTDMLHWKESGFSGSFFSFKCRSVRIGSYRFTPVDCVLFSPEGLMIRAPVLNSQETSKSEWIDLNLPVKLLLQVETHFDQDLLVIFLFCTPSLCRRVSAELNLRGNSGKFWDCLSMDKSQRLLTLFPCCLDDSVKNALKETFSCPSINIFRPITTFEAHKTLLSSSPNKD